MTPTVMTRERMSWWPLCNNDDDDDDDDDDNDDDIISRDPSCCWSGRTVSFP
jgi:hypothetical protein